MERWMDHLRGEVTLRATGAQPEQLLNYCAAQGIGFWDVRTEDAFSVCFTVRRRDEGRIEPLARRSGCTVSRLREKGAPKRLRFLRRRGALVIGAVLVLGLLFWSSLYIWEIDVTGNETVPTGTILNALEDSGVGIGSFWPEFTSDNIRSRVLSRVPELSWITVNVNGSCAEVIVRERTEPPVLYDEDAFSNIVSGCGGVVEEVRALAGVPLVKKGDTVAAGDVLITGEAENIMENTRYLCALGSVRARTWHELTAVCPLEAQKKGGTETATWRFSIGLAEELLKIYPNSGILPAHCGKIIAEHELAVENVFVLPVVLRMEHLERYNLTPAAVDMDSAAARLQEKLLETLRRTIGEDGEICSHTFDVAEKNGLLLVTLRAECVQEIGVAETAMP